MLSGNGSFWPVARVAPDEQHRAMAQLPSRLRALGVEPPASITAEEPSVKTMEGGPASRKGLRRRHPLLLFLPVWEARCHRVGRPVRLWRPQHGREERQVQQRRTVPHTALETGRWQADLLAQTPHGFGP